MTETIPDYAEGRHEPQRNPSDDSVTGGNGLFPAARGGRGAYNGSVSIDQAYHGNAEFPGQQSVPGCNSDYDCGVCRGLPDCLCADGAGVLQNCGIRRCTFFNTSKRL